MATVNQPVTYLAATDSSIETTDQVVSAGDGGQAGPAVFIEQYDAIVIEATPLVA